MAAGTSGGGCGARSITAARSVGYPGDGLAHSSELDAVGRDAAGVGRLLVSRLADAALRGGELGGGEHVEHGRIAGG
jgi:hypothetical protein